VDLAYVSRKFGTVVKIDLSLSKVSITPSCSAGGVANTAW
jgi:hypothetical protein